MVAARHQDAALLAHAYKDIDSLVLTIDGLQPEKGHETRYVVRDLRGKRVWFAEALLSSSTEEVQRLLAKAKDGAKQLGKPVQLWRSDKQDAFVKGIAAEFLDVPHRCCANHFLRDVAKPVLEADSHTKVQMRKKVRGLRDIEKQISGDRRQAQAQSEPANVSTSASSVAVASVAVASVTDVDPTVRSEPAAIGPITSVPAVAASPPLAEPAADKAGQVALEYCAAVRGILNDDQGGPLPPPGVRMAEALQEVRGSLQRNLAAKKGGVLRSSCASSKAVSTGDCRKSPRNQSRTKSTSKR